MDWDKAIERNGTVLLRILGALFALLVSARIAGSGLMVPRHVWRSILVVLRPAEAAVRRLIIIAARALPHVSFTLRQPVPNVSSSPVQWSADAFSMAPPFQLFDPLKPMSSIFAEDDDNALNMGAGFCIPEGEPDAPVSAIPLQNRLRALRHALENLSNQAQRLVRFNARRNALLNAGRPVRMSLVRPGLPPGWHARPKHEVDTVLRECHALVRYLDDPPDTS